MISIASEYTVQRSRNQGKAKDCTTKAQSHKERGEAKRKRGISHEVTRKGTKKEKEEEKKITTGICEINSE